MLTISNKDLSQYVNKQVENMFPDNISIKKSVDDGMKKALERVGYCFSRINNKYCHQDGRVVFNYQHTDHYASFLYFLSNTVWENSGDSTAAGKLYALNKALHGVDVFYEVRLPDIFFFSHPVGTVLGRAAYSDYLIISQGVTVGGNKDLIYPEIGQGTYLFSQSAIIGKCKTGKNNLISIGTIVREANTPDNVIVHNHRGTLKFKPVDWNVKSRYFR